ncbi:hypothetical protein G6F22_012522 [Rhizopus arrhizus]|nr:hypothetical protein G6F22_012522 [Rhizopus arrhizus]KAG1252671.1 hypothetical protein G6F68_011683 [Rhizopus microsporus]
MRLDADVTITAAQPRVEVAARPVARPLHLPGIAVDRTAEAVHRQLRRHRARQAQRHRGAHRFDVDAATRCQPGRCQLDAARHGFHRQPLHPPGVHLDPAGHGLRTDITGYTATGLDPATDRIDVKLRCLQASTDTAADRVELAVATAPGRTQAAADRIGLQAAHVDAADVLAGADPWRHRCRCGAGIRSPSARGWRSSPGAAAGRH